MTLIAYHAFENGSRPIVISDVLASSCGPVDSPVELPTVDQPLEATNDFAISGLVQKVMLVTDEVIVAVAGNMLGARMFCRELSTRLTSGEAKDDNLARVIDATLRAEKLSLELGDLSVIACRTRRSGARQETESVYFSTPNLEPPLGCETSIHGQVMACGSGSETYLRLARQGVLEENNCATSHQLYREILLAFMPLGRFLAEESSTGIGHLREGWGAGFELTFFAEGRYQKLQDILYVITEIVLNGASATFEPVRLLKLHYVEEHLFVRSVAIRRKNVDTYDVVSDRTFYIRPLLNVTPKPLTPKVGLSENNWLCLAAAFDGPSGRRDTVVGLIPNYARIDARNAGRFGPLPYSVKELASPQIEFTLTKNFVAQLSGAIWARSSEPRRRTTAWIWATECDEHRRNLVRESLDSIERAIADAVGKGFALSAIATIVAELCDPVGRALVERSVDLNLFSPDSVVTLIETLEDATEMLAFNEGAAAAIHKALPDRYVRLTCVAAGGVTQEVFLVTSQGKLCPIT